MIPPSTAIIASASSDKHSNERKSTKSVRHQPGIGLTLYSTKSNAQKRQFDQPQRVGSVKHERGKLLNIMQNLKQMQQTSKNEKTADSY